MAMPQEWEEWEEEEEQWKRQDEEWILSVGEQFMRDMLWNKGNGHRSQDCRVSHVMHSILKEQYRLGGRLKRLDQEKEWKKQKMSHRRHPPSKRGKKRLRKEVQRIEKEMACIEEERYSFFNRVCVYNALMDQQYGHPYDQLKRRLCVAILDSHGNIRDLTPLPTTDNQELGLAQGNGDGQAGPPCEEDENQANVEEGMVDAAKSRNSEDANGLAQHNVMDGHHEGDANGALTESTKELGDGLQKNDLGSSNSSEKATGGNISQAANWNSLNSDGPEESGSESKESRVNEETVNANNHDDNVSKEPLLCINNVDVPGMTPLMNAVRAGHYDVVEVFVEPGADCSVLEKLWEYLPLYWTVLTKNNSQEVLPIMMKNGFNLASECYQVINVLAFSDVCMMGLSYHDITPFESLFLERKFRVAEYRYAMPITLLLGSHGQQEQLDALKSYLDAGLQINPTRLDVSPPLSLFLWHHNSPGLTDSLHLSFLRLLESRGLDPDYTSSHNTFGVPDSLVAASMSDPRTLAFLLTFSRTTPQQILDRWTDVLMGNDDGGHVKVVREDHRTAFTAHMKATRRVAVKLGGCLLGYDHVRRFQEAVDAATETLVDWEDLHEPMDRIPTLKHLCRWEIRRALSQSRRQDLLIKSVLDQLEVPETMKSFLLYSDVDLLEFPRGRED